MRRLVIVGASLAGVRAAQAVRRAAWDGELVIVGDERHAPYTRPPLSKELLTAPQAPSDELLLPTVPDAQWMLGQSAVGLDRASHELHLASGRRLRYDRLVVATGATARRWTGRGADLEGLFRIRTLDDALRLRSALDACARIAILGAGFLGSEVAAAAKMRGLDVVMVDQARTPMAILGPTLGGRCADLHRVHGVDLRLGQPVHAVLGRSGRVCALELAGGETIPVDAVVVALGAIPATDWMAGTELASGSGLHCDATLTSHADPDVLGAGDVVYWPHPLAQGRRMRIEHWTNAADQGAHAGRNALVDPGDRLPYEGTPSFWSDQHGVRIQAVGLPAEAERFHLIHEAPEVTHLVAVGERKGCMVAGVAFNATRELLRYSQHLGRALDLESLISNQNPA